MGPSTDRHNLPVIDPTKNVDALVEASNRRQDDLREQEANAVRELISLRADYEERLRVAESARIDAIRAVDVNAVAASATAAEARATALAAQVAASAEAMRNQVAAAATAASTALAAALDPIQKDVADLRRVQYEQQGQRAQAVDHRVSTSAVAGYVFGAIGVLFATISLIILLVHH
jgi:leucyl aminopeptidase (aminopeptidase T)